MKTRRTYRSPAHDTDYAIVGTDLEIRHSFSGYGYRTGYGPVAMRKEFAVYRAGQLVSRNFPRLADAKRFAEKLIEKDG